MRSIMPKCCLAACAAVVLAVGTGHAQTSPELAVKLPAHVTSEGVIKIGSPRTVPPHIFMVGNDLSGIAVDLTKAMEPILGVPFEFLDMQWPGIIPGLQSGSIDLSMAMMSYKEDRKELFNMIPYINDRVSLLTMRDGTEFDGTDQGLCGKRIGTVQASWFVDLAQAANKRCTDAGLAEVEVMQYSANSGVLAAIQSSAVDGWLHTAVELSAVAASLEDRGQIIAIEGPDWQTGALTIATAKSETGLAEALQGAMTILKENGTYDEILAKYHVKDMGFDAFAINP